jgi:hypothetical protein
LPDGERIFDPVDLAAWVERMIHHQPPPPPRLDLSSYFVECLTEFNQVWARREIREDLLEKIEDAENAGCD